MEATPADPLTVAPHALRRPPGPREGRDEADPRIAHAFPRQRRKHRHHKRPAVGLHQARQVASPRPRTPGL